MTGHRETEAALIRRALGGEEAALWALFDHHADALQARARSCLSPGVLRKVSIADVMQEARLVALRRIPEFEHRDDGALVRWLGRIVELQARAVVRRYAGTAKRDPGREVTRGARPDTHHVIGAGPSPSQTAMGHELEARVDRAMDELSADHRQVLQLLRSEEMNFEEAGARLGRSADATRMLYGRAVSRLAELLDLEDGER